MSATLKDVAKAAGVNFTLVSKLLNDPDLAIRPETRKRIEDAIRQLDYQPSRSARALRLGHSDLLGLVIGDLTNEFYAHYADAALKIAASYGCRMLISAAAMGDPFPAIRDLQREQVRGILSCFPVPEGMKEVLETVFPMAGMVPALRQAAEYLQERGCRSAAILYSREYWRMALESSGFCTVLSGSCELAAATPEERRTQLEVICAARPDVIFTGGWQCATMLCNMLEKEYTGYHPAVLLSANCRGPFLRRKPVAGVFYSATHNAIERTVAHLLGKPEPESTCPAFVPRGTPAYDRLLTDHFCLT